MSALKGVPQNCLSVDEVSAAVKVQFRGVYPNAISGALVCEYYVDSGSGSPVVSMNFEPDDPAAAPQWQKQAMAAQPAAKPVTGVGDAALFFATAKYSEFDLISGSTVCNITASAQFTETDLKTLAEFLLEG